MKRKIIHILMFVLLVSFVSASGDDQSVSLEEQAFDNLDLRIKEERLNEKACEKLGFVDESGGRINLSDGGTMSFDNEYEGCRYQLEFGNKELADLKDLKVECRFFYNVESEWRVGHHRTEEEIKYTECDLAASVGSGEKVRLETVPFIMNSYAYPSGVYNRGGKAEVVECSTEGLWIRISYTTPDGQKLEREFCEPKSLMKRINWEGRSI
jgi:hypothetical protein